MTAPDPRLDEIQARLSADWEASMSGGYIGDDQCMKDRDFLLAELRKARRAAETLGQVIEKQCRDVLDVTGLHHLINEDGDGHWDVVWMRLFEMRDELASLKESTIGRERARGDSWRDRAQETTVRLEAAVEDLRKRDEVIAKLSDWAGRYKSAYYDEAQDDVVQIIRPVLLAAVAAAKGDERG